MKKNVLILICIGMIIAASIISCTDGAATETSSDSILPVVVMIDGTEYDTEASYDFGLTEAGSTGATKTITFKNSSESAITVTSVLLSEDSHYSLTAPTLPVTTPVDGTAEISLTFNPQASGDLNAILSIVIDGITDPFVLNLTGEGNYAPIVKFGILVSDSNTADTNGFYLRNSELLNNKPKYTKESLPIYYSYSYSNDGDLWCFHNIIDISESNTPLYDEDRSGVMVPPESGWLDSDYNAQPLKVTRYDITGTTGNFNETLTANYLYSDAEGDSEATSETSFQWYSSNTVDGTYTAIPGETDQEYILPNAMGYFLKVEIKPAASTGITEGTAVLSSSTTEIFSQNIVAQ